LAASILGILLAVLGCAGAGRAKVAESPEFLEEPVTVTLVPGKELRKQYGYAPEENPFISPKPLITRKLYDFIVLRFKAVGVTELELLQADAVDEAGSICASFYPREEFTKLSLFLGRQEPDDTTSTNKIGWYYLPKKKMSVPSGSHSYLLAIVGKHPLPETVTVQVRLRVGGEEKSFEFRVNVAEAA